jgi:hypothetical protein
MRGGTATVTESLLRELLYAIGKAKPTTQRLKDIRQIYQIDNLFPRHDTGRACTSSSTSSGWKSRSTTCIPASTR